MSCGLQGTESFLPLAVELLSNTLDVRVSAVLLLFLVVEKENLCVYFQLQRRWQRLRYLFVFSAGSFSTFHAMPSHITFKHYLSLHLGQANTIRAELGNE